MMSDDPLEAVFSMVERAFMRLQAGDVLLLCLEEDNAVPMQKLVEGLVLAGPQSLNALREVRAEAASRKNELLGEFTSSKDSMGQVARQIILLEELEIYIEDWMWGLMYQSAHQRGQETKIAGRKAKLWH
jgi:hypothetical protein